MMMPGVAKPTQRAHVDYTLHSCPNRLKAFVSAEEAERLQKTPYAIVQVSNATMSVLQPCMLIAVKKTALQEHAAARPLFDRDTVMACNSPHARRHFHVALGAQQCALQP